MSIYRNSSLMIASVIGANVFSYAYHLITGRILGPAEYGQFGLILSFYTLLSLPFSGFYWAVLKYTGNSDEKDIPLILSKLSRIALIISVIFIVILVAGSPFWKEYVNIDSSLDYLIITLTFVGATLASLVRGRIHGNRRYKTISIITLSESLVRVLAVVVILKVSPNVIGALLAFCFGYVIPVLPFTRDFLRDVFEGYKKKRRQNTKTDFSWKFMMLISAKNTVLIGIMELSVLVANRFLTENELGYWNAALTLSRINFFVATGIISVLFAESISTASRGTAIGLLRRATGFYGLIAAAVVASFFMVPKWYIAPLYGADFTGAMAFLPWIGIGTALMGILQIIADFYLSRMKVSTESSE